MGITGTWEGFVSDPAYIFNYGTWGNVSSTGFSNVYQSGQELIANKSSNGYVLPSNSHKSNFAVDVSSYKYININTYIDFTTSNKLIHAYLSVSLSDTSSNYLTYYTYTFSLNTYTICKIDVSAINQRIFILLSFARVQSNVLGYVNGAKINQIYLSKS